jgi:hypothetical protein
VAHFQVVQSHQQARRPPVADGDIQMGNPEQIRIVGDQSRDFELFADGQGPVPRDDMAYVGLA